IIREDDKQVAAAEEFISSGAWMPLLAVAETAWVLEYHYSFSRDEIAASVEMLLKNAQVSVADSETIEDALGQFRAKSSVSFTDCLILESARRAGHLPLGTFDRRLSQLPGAQR